MILLFAEQAFAASCKEDEYINGLPVANLGFGIESSGKIRGLLNFSDLDSALIQKKQFNDKLLLVSMLQPFVTQKESIAFNYLGNFYDFFHFHVLTHHGVPEALLYHTQETSFDNRNPQCKYSYLDAQGRNWIQWFKQPEKIINAGSFFNPTFKDDDSYLNEHTIHSEFLNFFDEQDGWADFQISFFEVQCNQIPARYQSKKTNYFQLQSKQGKRCFLFVGNSTCSSEWGLNSAKCLGKYLPRSL